MTITTIDGLDPLVRAEPHPRIRERRREIEDQQARSRYRRLAALLALLMVGLLAVVAVNSPLLDVDEVRVTGARQAGPDTIRGVSSVEPGQALVSLDADEVAGRVEALPLIEQAEAVREWNGIVTINVVERTPVAQVAGPDGTMVIASDGMILEVGEGLDAPVPLISGAMFSYPLGSHAPVELSEAIAVAAAMPEDVRAVTERIQLRVDAISLRLVGGGLVHLGDARRLDEKFTAVRAFLAQVDLGCLDAITVDAPLVPTLQRDDSCV